MKRQFELGQRVQCDGYIKRSGNYYDVIPAEYTNDHYEHCLKPNGEEVEEFDSCEKYSTVGKPFVGIYVGVTTRCTVISCEYDAPEYGREGFYFHNEQSAPFAVVYYALNKKRLVPLDMIHEEAQNETD